jgi:hypothetical protein
MKRFALMTAVLVLGGAGSAAAQGGGAPMVSGRVFDDTTGCPLRGVAISAESSTAKTVTDANGRYYLKGVPTTPFSLQAILAGYAAETTNNVTVSDSAARVDFSLIRAMRDSSMKPRPHYPSMKCVLDAKDSGGRYDQR